MTNKTQVISEGAGDKLPLSRQMSYGAGQIAGQLFRDIPSLLLLFFMTNILGISPAVAGTAIFVPKLFVGAISDIAVGAYIDRIKARVPLYWWLLFGAITAPVSMILLFNVPSFAQGGQIGYVMLVLSIYMMVFSSFSVPYFAIASAISNSSHQRTVLMAWRLVFTAIGVLIAAGVAPAVVEALGNNARAYSIMSVLLGAACTVSLLIAFFGMKRAILNAPDINDGDQEASEDAPMEGVLSFSDMLRALRAPRFSVLLLANILQLAGTGMSYAAILYFLTYGMALDNPFGFIGFSILATTIGIISGQPVWVAVSKKLSKKPTYIIATFLHAAALCAWALTAQTSGIVGALIFSYFIGFGNSGWVMLGFSMVADIADEGRAGLFSSVWIAADKVGFALGGTLMVGLILSGFGFDAGRAVAGLPQSDSAIIGVVVAFGVVPALLYVLSAGIFHVWGTDPNVEKT